VSNFGTFRKVSALTIEKIRLTGPAATTSPRLRTSLHLASNNKLPRSKGAHTSHTSSFRHTHARQSRRVCPRNDAWKANALNVLFIVQSMKSQISELARADHLWRPLTRTRVA